MMDSIFKDFTNLYSLTKTLRFELKPVGNTQKMLEDAKVFEKDKVIKEKYQKTKPYFDRMHREFINEALSDVILSGLKEYFEALEKWKSDKKDKMIKTDYDNKLKFLRKQIIQFFDAKANDWISQYFVSNPKTKGSDFFFSEDVFDLLKIKYGKEEETLIENENKNKISIFDSWKGFTGYFLKFQETRKNLYKDDGTSTAIATRLIDENLKRFSDNLEIFEKIKNKIHLSEIEQIFDINPNSIFEIQFYNKCLIQEGINNYNKILGKINELINKYRQDNKGDKTPFLTLLDKQILSEKEKFIENIETDEKLLEVLKDFYNKSEERINNLQKLFKDFVTKNEDYDLSQIYISKEAFNTISHKWTNETENFEKVLFQSMKEDNAEGISHDKKENKYKFPDFISLNYIQNAVAKVPITEKFWKERYYKSEENEAGIININEDMWKQFLQIFYSEFSALIEGSIVDAKGEVKKIGYNIYKQELNELINQNNFHLDGNGKFIIKSFADEVLSIYQMAKYFAVEKKRKWLTEYDLGDFYSNPDFGYYEKFHKNAYEDIIPAYNDVRNYLTKKAYSEEKWKLNFENPTLADGWDKNKESDNFAILLRKNGKYLLGLMRKGANKLFDDRNHMEFSQHLDKGKYEKVVYKLLPGANKMLPKVFFSASNIDFYAPSEKVNEIRNYASHAKNGTPQKGFDKKDFNLNDCHVLIDFFKQSIAKHPDWKNFNFKFSETRKYQNISDFYHEVENGGYKISFQDISEEYINRKNQNSELYLFEIHNKDWNLKDGNIKTGSKNLHTLYFESLFSDKNITQNFPMKLNGQAEIFYRPKTDEEKLGYRENSIGGIKMFIDKHDGNKEKKVIKNKRYVSNKIFFHVPMTMNRSNGNIFNFNAEINKFLAQNPNINIIGVDRGEKHLAYYSVIDQKGNVIDSNSLNIINGINYAEKLKDKAKNREQARKDWQSVEGIKDLKKGYISQVVRKLADLVIEHNAIVVFEDLNMRFKQIRGGIEKSIYQQLEKALIEKLNFLVNKNEINLNKAGHLLKAYQLTAPFEAFKDMSKQTGVIFYTQASYTSKIDPLTGWRPNLYLKYNNAEKTKTDILKFSDLKFNKDKNRFEFTYDLKDFTTQKEYPNITKWTLCSCIERFRWNKSLNQNKGSYEHYKDLTENFIKLFAEFNVNLQNIQENIKNLDTKSNEKFFKQFIFLFNLICQIRNTDDSENAKKEGKDDFILSPVEPFFDSRKSKNFSQNLPTNGDENGAYNIARKAIIILNRIAGHSKEDPEFKKYPDLFISSVGWDNFAQK